VNAFVFEWINETFVVEYYVLIVLLDKFQFVAAELHSASSIRRFALPQVLSENPQKEGPQA